MELTPLVLSGFKRVNDKVAPDLIGQDELAVLTDAVLDYKLGKPVKRGHFSRYDAGTSAGADILKLADVKDSSGQQVIFAAVSDDLRGYNPSTNSWSDLITSLGSGFKFRMIPFNDTFILVFDTDKVPRYLNNDFADYGNLELSTASSSDIANIKSYHDTGGGLSTKTQYKWLFVGLTEDGQYSPPSKPFTHFYSSARTMTTDDGTYSSKIYFKDLPYIADQRVKSRMLFRTKKANQIGYQSEVFTGEIYYLVTILDNDPAGAEYQSEFLDDIADDDLGVEIAVYLNMPTRAKYIAYSNERMILGNFSQINRNHVSLPSSNALFYDGTHTGADNASTLTDGTQAWAVNSLIGKTVYNITDGSSGVITANTATTITATLSGGSQNDWDIGEYYYVGISGLTSTAFGYGLVGSAAHDTSTPGLLTDSTQYDYRIHVVDRYGRLSKSYHQVTVTTGSGADDYRVQIDGMGSIDTETAKEYPQIAVYRRTGGTGSYYLIFRGDWSTAERTGRCYFSPNGQFIDYGASNLTETWSDPDANINSYPSGICFSEISSPSTIRDEDKRNIYPDDSSEITGLFDDQDGVVIFKKNNINKVFISGNPNNWRLVQLCREYGCDQPDTIQKSGSSYYFVYQNKAYRYDYGAEKPVDIGYLFQNTLNLVTDWYDSTINDRWYCIQCKLASTTYYTLVYDIKLDTWYKFKRTQSASEDFKTIYFTKYGVTEELLSNADDYVSLYNNITDYSVITRADGEIGSTQQISPLIQTKVFKSDGVSLVRFRKLKFDYTKVDDQNTVITLTDKDTLETIVLTDSTNSTNSNDTKLYEIGIGRATDTLKTTASFDITVQGAGLERWDNLRVEGRQIHKGKEVSA